MQPKGVTVVQDKETAEKVLAKLMTLTKHYHACDTETIGTYLISRNYVISDELIDIDLGVESPVGHGKIICASIYCGPDIDFGNGPRVCCVCAVLCVDHFPDLDR